MVVVIDECFVPAFLTLQLALFVWMILDARYRTLHDRIAGTYVVRGE